jgi:hypothetical protein
MAIITSAPPMCRSQPSSARRPTIAAATTNEDADPDGADEQVEQQGRGPAPEPEGTADDEHAERLAGERHGQRRDDDLRAERHDERADRDQQDVADSSRESFRDPDRDEEVGEGEPLLRSRGAVQAGDRDRHRGSTSGVARAATCPGV